MTIKPNIIYFVLSIAVFAWGFIHKYRCERRNRGRYPSAPETPALLGSINFIGFTMLGNFEYADGVTVSYCCLSVLGCPVIPFSCYECRVQDYEGKTTTYGFLGRQPWRFAEVSALYSRWGLPLAIFNLIV